MWLDAANSTQDEARERLAAYQPGLRPAIPATPATPATPAAPAPARHPRKPPRTRGTAYTMEALSRNCATSPAPYDT